MNKPLVEIHNLHKSFGDVEVLRGVDLTVNDGEVVALLGASGSGKSTLLRCINVLEKPNSGFIRVGDEIMGYKRTGNRLHEIRGRQLARQRAQIGMVFQHFNLYENMTARENVSIALVLVRKLSKQNALEEADRFLDRVGLLPLKNSYPSRLSGGQQQRVGIARVLAMRPSLVLLDEPTSALDPELVGEVLAVIKEIVDLGVTMMIVTHEIAFARSVSDRAIFMGDGEIIEAGDSDKVLGAPEHERTKSFLKSVL